MLDSLATTNYPNSHRPVLVIADGLVKGSGNDLTTPDMVLGMLTDLAVPKEERRNMAKVYAGIYKYDSATVERSKQQKVPIVLAAKCGNPLEAGEAKPGNRVMFDKRMTTFEYEIFNSIWCVTGVSPDRYEIVLCIDADTKVSPDSLPCMVICMAHDEEIGTKIANKAEMWNYISHHLTKAFESMFGGVTCLPGCFSIYRIEAPKGQSGYGVPILANPDIVEHYSENIVDTLHKKNLLLLGEDRYLTTLILKTFPRRKMVFRPQAVCKTIVPDTFSALFSQRCHWINSTIHNLAKLVLIHDLYGTFCFSMQFVVFMELAGTLVLPATIPFTICLIVISTLPKTDPKPVLSSCSSFSVTYRGWMLIYLLSLPIWNSVLPVYAFWHFDDFSWGQTRMVAGERRNKATETGRANLICRIFDQSRSSRTRVALQGAKRRLKKRLGKLLNCSGSSESGDQASSSTSRAPSDIDVAILREDIAPSEGTKRTATHDDAPSSPEQPRRPTHKKSRVELALNPEDIVLSDSEPKENTSSQPETETSAQPEAGTQKPTRRGKRAGVNYRAQLDEWKEARQKRNLTEQGDIAKYILKALRFLGKEIPLPKDINDLSPEEAIKYADGHRVNKEYDSYVFDATKQAETWQKKNGVKPGQFEGHVLTQDDLQKYNFRIFSSGTIYGFENDEQGNKVLVFSPVFIPFDSMDQEELEDFKFLGKHFAERRDDQDGLVTNNSAHRVEGAGGIMLGFGWRADTDTRGRFRLGVYAEHNGTDWIDSHGKHYRMAKICGRMLHRQAPQHHGAANNSVNTQRLPRLDDRELGSTTGSIPASNLTCTCNDFCNGFHRDKDAHHWTFGLWFPTYHDGQLVMNAAEVQNMTEGGHFALPYHGIVVDCGACPGVVALTWRGPVDLHGTVKSKTRPGYVRWGSSIQCTKRLKQRVDKHWAAVEE
ncbi:Chitin synthase, class 3, partial [Ceratobasidium sp. 423]